MLLLAGYSIFGKTSDDEDARNFMKKLSSEHGIDVFYEIYTRHKEKDRQYCLQIAGNDSAIPLPEQTFTNYYDAGVKTSFEQLWRLLKKNNGRRFTLRNKKTALLICGEQLFLTSERKPPHKTELRRRPVEDAEDLGLDGFLSDNFEVILNPWHSYSDYNPHLHIQKCRALSKLPNSPRSVKKRTFLSVYNWKDGQENSPFAIVACNGEDALIYGLDDAVETGKSWRMWMQAS